MIAQTVDLEIANSQSLDDQSLDNQPVTYEVIHLTPERIRIRIPRLESDRAYRNRLNELVTNISGVTEVRINDLAQSLIVHHDAESNVLQQLKHTIVQAQHLSDSPQELSEPAEFPLQRLIVPTLGLGLALLAAPLELPIPALLLGGITVYGAIPMFTRAIASARQGEITGETLESIWTVMHSWHGDFHAPNLSLTIAGTAEVLRDATGQEAKAGWRHLIPVETVHVIRDGKECPILVSELQCHETIVLYPGEISSIDGTILDGEGLLDVSALTGEAVPISCCPNSKIWAGSLVIEGKLRVLVEQLENDTEYAREAHLADKILQHKTDIAEYAEEVGRSMMLPTLGLSGAIFLVTADVARSLAPLQLDLATGISISAPTAILSTIERAKQSAIYVRCGYTLETLTKADVVIFSKTGTLTQGTLTVVAVEPIGVDAKDNHPISESELVALAASELIALAASVKRGLRHPVAEAIVRYAQTLEIEIFPCEVWEHYQNLGLGVSAIINGSRVLVGSRHYLSSEGVDLTAFPEPICAVGDADGQGLWFVYVARDGQLLGRIDCCDQVRPESRSVIAALHDRGLEVYMVTSNSRQVADRVADWLELPNQFVHAEVLPEMKLRLLDELQTAGKIVIYVGEGLDDYAAMRKADVAIGTHRSCPLNREMADLLLPDGNLSSLLLVLDLAQSAIDIIHQNITLIAVPNISIVLLGIIFALDPILAVILNQSANLLAELNSLRPLWNMTLKPDESVQSLHRSEGR